MQPVTVAFATKWFRLGFKEGEAVLRHHADGDSWTIFLKAVTQNEINDYVVVCSRGHVRRFKKLQTAVDTARSMGYETMNIEFEPAELEPESP